MPDVNARILLWGIEGAGKTTTLQTIQAKLRADLRGELRSEPTRLDPTVHYEILPISLGEVSGVATHIELVAVPGAADQQMTRMQLLDEIDGLILLLDASPERIDANAASLDELRASLEAYGQTLETLPIVLQYNKRDVADPFAIEDLHRQLGLEHAAVFETIATTGHGILPTLTTISKHVVRARRGTSGEVTPELAQAAAQNAPTPAPPIEPPTPAEPLEDADGLLEALPLDEAEADASDLSTAELLESAILAEGEAENFQTLGALEVDLDAEATPWAEADPLEKAGTGSLRVVSAGQARVTADGHVRLPLVLDDENGQSRSVVLTLRLDDETFGDGGGD